MLHLAGVYQGIFRSGIFRPDVKPNNRPDGKPNDCKSLNQACTKSSECCSSDGKLLKCVQISGDPSNEGMCRPVECYAVGTTCYSNAKCCNMDCRNKKCFGKKAGPTKF